MFPRFKFFYERSEFLADSSVPGDAWRRPYECLATGDAWRLPYKSLVMRISGVGARPCLALVRPSSVPKSTALGILTAFRSTLVLLKFILICLIMSACFIARAEAADETSEPKKPIKLFGRIEQLSTESGATLPLKGQTMQPKLDSAPGSTTGTKLSASAAQAFPLEFLGTWSGPLAVISFNSHKNFFEFDTIEARTQADLLKIGTVGTCSVTFFRGANEGAEMKPCSVTFEKELPNTGGSNIKGNGANAEGPGSYKPHRYIYHLHFGDLSTGQGVTGNEITCQLLKNTLRQLAARQMEQEVITRDSDRNPLTGKIKTGYSESVLLFTQVNNDELYTQAASVSYGGDAAFLNKVILCGTLKRISK